MRGVLVALDLETTGLDASSAHIIEIGAVKFRDQQIIETYTTLVDPGVPIPPKITDITGIRPEDLVGAPKLPDVLPALAEFAGNAVLVGHNINFDLGFLKRHDVLKVNDAVDTYELASVLLPTASRYNLNALMQELNIEPDGNYHRALNDAAASARLYMALWEKLIKELPIDLLREIALLAKALPRSQQWRGLPPFEAALRVREGERLSKTDLAMRAFTAPEGNDAPPQPTAVHTPLTAAADTESGSNGALAAIYRAFNDDEALLLETVSEATPGYLIAAAQWTHQNGERIILSTGSDALRRRLLDRAIPAVCQALGRPLQAVLLRRRSEYLCPARLQVLRRQGPVNVEELRLLAKTLIWLVRDTPTVAVGPGQLSIRGPGEHAAWLQLSAEADGCTQSRCQAQMNGLCPLYRDRRAAENAQFVVVDHTMLVASADSHDPLLPDYQRIVIDEAHLLEDSVTDGLHTRIDPARLKRQIAEIGSDRRGLLSDVLVETKPALPETLFEGLSQFVATLSEASAKMAYHVDNLFRAMRAFLDAVSDTRPGDFAIQVRLTRELRAKPAFSQVRAAWSILGQFTETLPGALGQLARRLASFREKHNTPADLVPRVQSAARNMERAHKWLNDCIAGQPENTVYWAEIGADAQGLTLHAAPLRVSVPLKRAVWDNAKTVIVTGATLRVGGSFDYLRSQLGLDSAQTHVVADPNDEARSILVFLPSDMPEPNERERYQRAVERGIIELATATEGRLIALFTSHTQLRQSGQNIAARLKLGGITVFDQSDGTSQNALLDGFRETPRAVLLGVRGFWDDVEFAPDDLVALVVVRLPFAVPNEPVFAARNESFDDPLNQHTVPHAILRFRQSAEHLIHSQRRGVIAIFDKRMTSKEYGQTFLDSLPPATIQRAPLADLPAAARNWLNNR